MKKRIKIIKKYEQYQYISIYMYIDTYIMILQMGFYLFFLINEIVIFRCITCNQSLYF